VRDQLAAPDQPADGARADAEHVGGLLHREERAEARCGCSRTIGRGFLTLLIPLKCDFLPIVCPWTLFVA
jgi:hypothetical protein